MGSRERTFLQFRKINPETGFSFQQNIKRIFLLEDQAVVGKEDSRGDL